MYSIHWFNSTDNTLVKKEFETPEEAYEQVISALWQRVVLKGRNNQPFFQVVEFPIVNKAYTIGSNGTVVDGGEVYKVLPDRK